MASLPPSLVLQLLQRTGGFTPQIPTFASHLVTRPPSFLARLAEGFLPSSIAAGAGRLAGPVLGAALGARDLWRAASAAGALPEEISSEERLTPEEQAAYVRPAIRGEHPAFLTPGYMAMSGGDLRPTELRPSAALPQMAPVPPSTPGGAVAQPAPLTPGTTAAAVPTAAAPAASAPPPSPTLDELIEADRRQRETSQYRAPIRAVRLPSGRVVFTNLESWEQTAADAPRGPMGGGGGAEIPYSEAVGAERREALDPSRTPVGAALTGILRAQVRALESGKERMQGAEEELPSAPTGNVSMMPGTPEQQAEIAFRDLANATAVAQARQQLATASLPPAVAAILQNPQALTTMWLMRAVAPQITAIHQQAAEQIKQIEASVADPKERERQIMDIQTQEQNAVDALNAVMASGARQRIPY